MDHCRPMLEPVTSSTRLGGYEDGFEYLVDFRDVAYDGRVLLERPAFWATYLGQWVDDDELPLRACGGGESEFRDMQRLLQDPHAWPVIGVDLGHTSVAIVRRNLEDDEGVDFLLVPADGEGHVLLAALDGHQTGPGISWSELVAVADRTPHPDVTLLLLVPMLGDVEATRDAAQQRLSTALRSVGGGEEAPELAEMLASEAWAWDPANWSVTEDGVTVCDGELSLRNPDSVFGHDPETLGRISAAFAGLGGLAPPGGR